MRQSKCNYRETDFVGDGDCTGGDELRGLHSLGRKHQGHQMGVMGMEMERRHGAKNEDDFLGFTLE